MRNGRNCSSITIATSLSIGPYRPSEPRRSGSSDRARRCVRDDTIVPPAKPVNEVFLVGPNPNPNIAIYPLYIKYVSARNQAAECTIYNILGETITKFSIENNNKTPVYLYNLKKGLYFLSLTDYHGTSVKKIIIL